MEHRHSPLGFRDHVKLELFRFCQYTTIRGVSRIVNAKRRSIKLLWSMFVFLLIVGLTACLFLLTRSYLDYNVIHPPRVLRDEPAPFPSLTLCNLRPLSHYGKTLLNQEGIKDPRSFMVIFQEYLRQMYPDKMYLPAETTQAYSFGSYIGSIPRELLDKIGQNIIEQVFHCKVNYMNGSSPYTRNCDAIGVWSNLLHPLYLNCATLNFLQEYRNTIQSVELYMYLNESMTETECVDCFAFEIKSQLSGATVVLHNADTYPDIDFESIYIQPGTLTELKIRTSLNIQKEPPYGHCSEDTPKHLCFNNQNFTYSEDSCKKRVKQEEINKLCNCSAVEFPMLDESLDFCMSVSSFVNKDSCQAYTNTSQCTHDILKIVSNAQCKNSLLSRFSKDVVPNCTLPCSFYSYETDRSTSTWPTKSFQLTWVKKMKNLHVPELDYYRRVQNITNDEERAKAMYSTSILEKNLVALMLIKPNSNVQKVEEKEVISLTSFLSQTGGLLSIWIGLSMICVVEVIELLMNIWALFRGRQSVVLSDFSNSNSSDNLMVTPKTTIKEERDDSPSIVPRNRSLIKRSKRSRRRLDSGHLLLKRRSCKMKQEADYSTQSASTREPQNHRDLIENSGSSMIEESTTISYSFYGSLPPPTSV